MKLNMIYPIILVVVLLFVGTVYFHDAEKWSYTDSFYFSTMTLTTIGYGDLAPTQNATKIFTSVYSIFGIGAMLFLLTAILSVFWFKQEKRFDKIFRLLYKKRSKR